jgi:hypothetical protein
MATLFSADLISFKIPTFISITPVEVVLLITGPSFVLAMAVGWSA